MTKVTDLLGFEQRHPSHQNAIDLFDQAWVSAFPASTGVTGGNAAHFDDTRVTWAASALGGLHGRTILELGPFEAYNTFQFQAAGASSTLSIESSHVNFLKCLIVKNLLGLSATFLLGDFQEFLKSTKSRFDICWASGVLYHMVDPIGLLRGIRRVADTAFIWTQYYDAALLAGADNLKFFDKNSDKVVEFAGRQIVLHHRNYMESAGLNFSGGEAQHSFWMERNDIMFVLQQLGYDVITIGIDNPNHPPGPAMFFIARASQ